MKINESFLLIEDDEHGSKELCSVQKSLKAIYAQKMLLYTRQEGIKLLEPFCSCSVFLPRLGDNNKTVNLNENF